MLWLVRSQTISQLDLCLHLTSESCGLVASDLDRLLQPA